jgi:hypothetical protein
MGRISVVWRKKGENSGHLSYFFPNGPKYALWELQNGRQSLFLSIWWSYSGQKPWDIAWDDRFGVLKCSKGPKTRNLLNKVQNSEISVLLNWALCLSTPPTLEAWGEAGNHFFELETCSSCSKSCLVALKKIWAEMRFWTHFGPSHFFFFWSFQRLRTGGL